MGFGYVQRGLLSENKKRQLTVKSGVDWSEEGVLHLRPQGCGQTQLRHHVTKSALRGSQQLDSLFS